MSNKNITNHLTKGYSDLVFSFLLKYGLELSLNCEVLDVGCGHYRNLKLFQDLGFKNLSGIDRNVSNNPLHININFTQGNIERGLPYKDRTFDVVLCNYVLMFIKPSKIKFVIDELLRVCNYYLLIETYPKKSKGTFYEDYNFEGILKYIKSKSNFEVLKEKSYYEKILIRRKPLCLWAEKMNI